MMGSVVHDAAKGYVDVDTGVHIEVHGTWWCWRPRECPWSVLLPETMKKSMIYIPPHYKHKEATFAVESMAADPQLKKRDM